LLVDAHAHLDEPGLEDFVEVLCNTGTQIVVVSNSVNLDSSIKNLELCNRSDKIWSFVGIHPDVVRPKNYGKSVTPEILDEMIEGVRKIAGRSSGIGEIGLDPKYGFEKEQERLFHGMLSICEKTTLPSSIHNRNSVAKILDILSTFALKGSVLLHWFAGTEEELKKIQDRGFYVSFGQSILTSKRMQGLVDKTSIDFLLPETDAPTPFAGLNNSIGTPFLIASVVFEICFIKKISFEELQEKMEKTLWNYLGTQTSLRVRRK